MAFHLDPGHKDWEVGILALGLLGEDNRTVQAEAACHLDSALDFGC